MENGTRPPYGGKRTKRWAARELAAAILYVNASPRVAAMAAALLHEGDRHDRHAWTAILGRLEAHVGSLPAMLAIVDEATRAELEGLRRSAGPVNLGRVRALRERRGVLLDG